MADFDRVKFVTSPRTPLTKLHVPSLQSGFSQTHNIGNNANICIGGFDMWKQKSPVENVTHSGNRTQASHNLWFQVEHSPFYTKLSCTT